MDGAGVERLDAREWSAWNAGLPVRFAASAGVRLKGSAKRVVPVEPAVERPAKRPRIAGLAVYESYAPVAGAGCNVCLKCGDAWGGNRPAGEVCGGFAAELPELVRMLLQAGASDDSLVSGRVGVRALAGRRGWGGGGPYEPAPPPD